MGSQGTSLLAMQSSQYSKPTDGAPVSSVDYGGGVSEISHDQNSSTKTTLREHIEEIEFRYISGETLQQIAIDFDCTRERVRQLLKGRGHHRHSGGAAIRRARQRELAKAAADQKRAERIYNWLGISVDQYKHFRSLTPSPTSLYLHQKNAAERVGIRWKFTFLEWWEFWNKSGRWERRGRGQGTYCMTRKDYTGPFSIDNVHIMATTEKASNYWLDRMYVKHQRLPKSATGNALSKWQDSNQDVQCRSSRTKRTSLRLKGRQSTQDTTHTAYVGTTATTPPASHHGWDYLPILKRTTDENVIRNIGKRIGRLTVRGVWAQDYRLWIVRCDCGRYEARDASVVVGQNADPNDACLACYRQSNQLRLTPEPVMTNGMETLHARTLFHTN